jgi:nicotinate-nucleotide pyrophosphorylase (carboxylating)
MAYQPEAPAKAEQVVMAKEFQQTLWDDDLRERWQEMLQLAIREDLGQRGDWTTAALVPEDAPGRADVVARQAGILAGEPAVAGTLSAFDPGLRWRGAARDSQAVARGQAIGRIEGPARGLLAAERLLLNFLGRLSGIATLVRQYVDAVSATRARIYDTRKTTPGWRRLEKYAVRCGGGWNHRTGLFDAVLIKDNHLALGAGLPRDKEGRSGSFGIGGPLQKIGPVTLFSPAEAVGLARRFLAERFAQAGRGAIIEIELDTLGELEAVLAARPDLILLDNMSPEDLAQAVRRRDACGADVELEASGGVDLGTVRRIAETGVERISVGALTHAAVSLDFGLDWLPG